MLHYIENYLKSHNRYILQIDNKFMIYEGIVNCYLNCQMSNNIIALMIGNDIITTFKLTICDVFNYWLLDSHLVIVDILHSIKLRNEYRLEYADRSFSIITKRKEKKLIIINFGEYIKLCEILYVAKKDYRAITKTYNYNSNILYDFTYLIKNMVLHI